MATEKLKLFSGESHADLAEALDACNAEGFRFSYAHEVANDRLEGRVPWDLQLVTATVAARGVDNLGFRKVVYADVPTSLTTPEGIRRVDQADLEELNHGCPFPREEFRGLIDRAEEFSAGERSPIRVYADSEFGGEEQRASMPIENAAKYIVTVASLGDRELAERYMRGFAENRGQDRALCRNDVLDFVRPGPIARLVRLGRQNFNALEAHVGKDLPAYEGILGRKAV